MWTYIDQEATDAANCVNTYKMKNSYAPDADITAEEVKLFRMWLATTLLLFDQNNRGQQLYNIFSFGVCFFTKLLYLLFSIISICYLFSI